VFVGVGESVEVGELVKVGVLVRVGEAVNVADGPVVFVDVGTAVPHIIRTAAVEETGDSVVLEINARLCIVVQHDVTVEAVAQYCTWPHSFGSMTPMFHWSVLVAAVHVPAGVVVMNPPKFRQVGKESVKTVPDTSLPANGPFPNTLRQQ
jgi:hypothetical protein